MYDVDFSGMKKLPTDHEYIAYKLIRPNEYVDYLFESKRRTASYQYCLPLLNNGWAIEYKILTIAAEKIFSIFKLNMKGDNITPANIDFKEYLDGIDNGLCGYSLYTAPSGIDNIFVEHLHFLDKTEVFTIRGNCSKAEKERLLSDLPFGKMEEWNNEFSEAVDHSTSYIDFIDLLIKEAAPYSDDPDKTLELLLSCKS